MTETTDDSKIIKEIENWCVVDNCDSEEECNVASYSEFSIDRLDLAIGKLSGMKRVSFGVDYVLYENGIEIIYDHIEINLENPKLTDWGKWPSKYARMIEAAELPKAKSNGYSSGYTLGYDTTEQ